MTCKNWTKFSASEPPSPVSSCCVDSGHAFKFLPELGRHVVDVVEGNDTPYTRSFKRRDVPKSKRNGLEDGPEGWRTLDKQETTYKYLETMNRSQSSKSELLMNDDLHS
jgi:hypothetical protein